MKETNFQKYTIFSFVIQMNNNLVIIVYYIVIFYKHIMKDITKIFS